MTSPQPPILPYDIDELLPTQRVGLVVEWLMLNPDCEYTTADLARYVGITWDGMYMQLSKLSAVLKLRQSLYGWSYARRI